MHIIALNRCWVIHWRWLLITLVAAGLLMALALWQLQRAAYKRDLSVRLEHLDLAGAVNSQQLQHLSIGDADGVRIAASAHWLAPYIWLLDNQMLHGKIGYDVIAPMQLDATGEVVLTNLGWVAAPLNRTTLPDIKLPKNFKLEGIVRTRMGGFSLGNNIESNSNWPMRIQRLAVDEFSAQIKTPLYMGVIYQLRNSSYLVHYQAVVMSPERHEAYALQWALLALAVLIIAAYASSTNAGVMSGGEHNVR